MNRKSHWDNIYRDKSPLEVSWYQAEPALSLHLIGQSGFPKEAAIIDVGGGSSLLVDRLYAQGYRNLAVLDISGIALNHARQRLGKAAQDIEWYEADVTSFVPPHGYDIWHDRAVFHFLTDEDDRKRYVATLKLALKPAGNLILAAFAIGGPTKCSGLNIVQYNDGKLVRELGEGFTLVEQLSETHITPGNQEQLFTYFRFVKDA